MYSSPRMRPAISIHAPVKGATDRGLHFQTASVDFNPRSREGSDRTGATAVPILADFNPRSREGSDNILWFHVDIPPYFNPRSREGSDLVTSLYGYVRSISIHAPVKGATAKITKTIPDDFRKINNYNNSFAQIRAKHNCKFDIR